MAFRALYSALVVGCLTVIAASPPLFVDKQKMIHSMPDWRASKRFEEKRLSGFVPPTFNWTVNWTTAYVDNLNFWEDSSRATFQLRYLYNNSYWGGPGYPIFMYAGNEGYIELFCGNAGAMFWMAEIFQALIVCPEHRFYGETLPFGNASYSTRSNLAYLSTEQALADYANFLASLKANLSTNNSPVITFGGSYGGMLAAWFRMKWPASTLGAIASSAPIFQIPGLMDPNGFYGIITNDYKEANPLAPAAIYSAWGVLRTLGGTAAGRQTIADALKMCEVPTAANVGRIAGWFEEAIVNSAEANYGVAADFLGPMPPWPVRLQSAPFNGTTDNFQLLRQMSDGIAQVYGNSSGQAGSCFNFSSASPAGVQGEGWGIQCCHEIAQPIQSSGPPNDMFNPGQPFSPSEFARECISQWNTTPRPYYLLQQFGGADIQRDFASYSNIFFASGHYDPWRAGDPVVNITASPSVISVIIAEGAHHAELRYPEDAEPPSVTAARNMERDAVKDWINAYNAKNGLPAVELLPPPPPRQAMKL